MAGWQLEWEFIWEDTKVAGTGPCSQVQNVLKVDFAKLRGEELCP